MSSAKKARGRPFTCISLPSEKQAPCEREATKEILLKGSETVLLVDDEQMIPHHRQKDAHCDGLHCCWLLAAEKKP